MSTPLVRLGTRVAYAATQLPRLAWYLGHSYLIQRLAEEARRNNAAASPQRRAGAFDPRRLYADMAELLAQDLGNVQAGIYPVPADHDGSLATLLRRSWLVFADLPGVEERRRRNNSGEVVSDKPRGRRPDYYLRNFHFQWGGWLTEDPADRSDVQVEVLFKGTANA